MQMFENDTNCSEIAIKSYYVKFSHTFDQLLILSENVLKISSFILHTSLQMRVPLVNCQESSWSFCRTALIHAVFTTLSGFWSRQYQSSLHQTTPNLIRWHTLSVASSIGCCVFKMSINWSSICFSFGTACNILLTAQ